MAFQERFRASPRRPVDVPVIVKTAEDRMDRKANLIDLGLKGACLELGEALVPGANVLLEVRSPMLWDPLQLRAHVVWTHWNTETGISHAGVRFDHDNSTQLFSLFEFLCSQAFET
jgi:hypothetical protein